MLKGHRIGAQACAGQLQHDLQEPSCSLMLVNIVAQAYAGQLQDDLQEPFLQLNACKYRNAGVRRTAAG